MPVSVRTGSNTGHWYLAQELLCIASISHSVKTFRVIAFTERLVVYYLLFAKHVQLFPCMVEIMRYAG